jgi:hypothetical protein
MTVSVASSSSSSSSAPSLATGEEEVRTEERNTKYAD